MNVNFKSMILYTNTTVTAMRTVQTPWAVTLVNAEKASLEMVSLAEVIAYYNLMKLFNFEYGSLFNFIFNI